MDMPIYSPLERYPLLLLFFLLKKYLEKIILKTSLCMCLSKQDKVEDSNTEA